MAEEEAAQVQAWAAGYFSLPDERKNVIGSLLSLQDRFGFLPKIGMLEVAGRLGVTPAQVFGVATFYNRFRFTPEGRHPVKVCMGTACHIKLGAKILEHWERRLEIPVGGTTADGEYSLDRVACVGCCTLAPVTVVGAQVVGHMSVTRIDGILLRDQLERDRAAAAAQAEKDKEGR